MPEENANTFEEIEEIKRELAEDAEPSPDVLEVLASGSD